MKSVDDLTVVRLRADTPGCDNVVHLNNAGASLMPRPVFDAVGKHQQRELTIGGYEAAAEASSDVEAFYHNAARLIGAAPSEIAFAENATRAWSMAFYGLRFGPGDRILTSVTEYASNYIAFLQMKERFGVEINIVPADGDGVLDVEELRRMIDGRVRLIAVSHVPTNGGLVQPAAEIGSVAKEHGVFYLLDACQSIGQMPVDVDEIGCDALSVTGRKYLRGPRGTGFLYVRTSALDSIDPPMLDLHSADWVAPDRYELSAGARRFETWEANVAAKLGLSAAMQYAAGVGLGAAYERIRRLAAELRLKLAELPGVRVQDLGREKCGIVTFTCSGWCAVSIRDSLRRQRINVSVSPRNSTLLDAEHRTLPEMVRASVHYYNSDEEIERFVAVLDGILTGR